MGEEWLPIFISLGSLVVGVVSVTAIMASSAKQTRQHTEALIESRRMEAREDRQRIEALIEKRREEHVEEMRLIKESISGHTAHDLDEFGRLRDESTRGRHELADRVQKMIGQLEVRLDQSAQQAIPREDFKIHLGALQRGMESVEKKIDALEAKHEGFNLRLDSVVAQFAQVMRTPPTIPQTTIINPATSGASHG